jgi:glycosyltransferase involved in cell wall biosynthesis
MLDIFERHDLLLVPLDNNEFNNAKSNIKYIEAGARGTPVLARDCNEFSLVIKDKKNGFLYNSENINSQLEYIYNNKHKLRQIGENARKDILKNHTISKANLKFVDFIRNEIC